MQDFWLSIHGPELALRSATEAAVFSNARIVGIHSDAAWRSCLELGEAAKPPTAENLGRKRVLGAKERKRPDVVDDHHVPRVVLRRSVEVAGVVGVGNDVTVVGAVIHA